jgi:hypothetical protein
LEVEIGMNPYNVFVASLLTIWCAQASTLSTDAECPGSPETQAGGPGVASGSCMAFGAFDANSSAQANVGVENGEASVFAGTDGFREFGFASASYDAILTLTVFGGSGAGTLLPINFFGEVSLPSGGTALAEGSFVGTNPGQPTPNCQSVILPFQIPLGECSVFIFGQPNTFTLICSPSRPM